MNKRLYLYISVCSVGILDITGAVSELLGWLPYKVIYIPLLELVIGIGLLAIGTRKFIQLYSQERLEG